MVNSKKIGSVGEEIASIFLKNKGFSVLERNYTRPYGEIDIIARKGKYLHFIEVKSVSRDTLTDSVPREKGSYYRPEEQVHERKLQKIRITAEAFLAEQKEEYESQIDVVAVYVSLPERRAQCRLISNV